MAFLGHIAARCRRWDGNLGRQAGFAGLAALALSMFPAALAQGNEGPSEYEVKAAFLHRFVSYVEWPEDHFQDKERFVIGVYGESPFNGILSTVFTDKELHGLAVEVRDAVSREEALSCDFLFVSADVLEEEASELAEELAELPVLTVGDVPRQAYDGFLVAFEMVENRVRFVINADAVSRSPLRISSRLMEVARIVRPGGASR